MSLKSKKNIQELIREHYRRLQVLKVKQAQKGRDVGPDTVVEINEIEEKIEDLQVKLAELELNEQAELRSIEQAESKLIEAVSRTGAVSSETILDAVQKRVQKVEENQRIEAQLAEIATQLARLYQKEFPPSKSPNSEHLLKDEKSVYVTDKVIIPASEMKRIESDLVRITAELAKLVHPKRERLSVRATGIITITVLTTSLPLDVESADFVKNELNWLFAATDHFLKIRQGQRNIGQPVEVAIPPYAAGVLTSNNAILISLDAPNLETYEKLVENIIRQINHHLGILNFEWDRDANVAGGDVSTKNSINSQLKTIISHTEQLAGVMSSIYGVMIHSPGSLVALLG